jgi:collagenase-like PrtC family protease
MPNIQFSLPYNNDPETLKQQLKLQGHGGNTISEIYLSGPQEYSGAGRIIRQVNPREFFDVIELVHANNIGVNIILNSTCEGMSWYEADRIEDLISFLMKICREYKVEAVTVANPLLICEIKQRLPGLIVCASVLSDIDCVQRALVAKQAGADIITPDANINRDIKLLNQIKQATGLDLKIMVNEGCLYKCLYRKFHFNYVSHYSKEVRREIPEVKNFFSYCMAITKKDPSQILKSGWIRPEDLTRYAGISDFFKVVGRTRPKSMILRAVKAYMQEHYAGNIFDILCSSLNAFSMSYGAYIDNGKLDEANFFDRVSSCDRNCSECDYCSNLVNRLLKLSVVTREKLEDMGQSEVADNLEAAGKLPYFS